VWPELREEVELELTELRELLASFHSLREKVQTSVPDTIETVALAGFMHAFYTGIENLFKRVAIHLDSGPPRGEAWHSLLLESMARAIESRPAVISESLLVRLRTYLDFRHVFRHAYSFQLRWEKMSGLVRDCEDTFHQVELEVNDFLNTLESEQSS